MAKYYAVEASQPQPADLIFKPEGGWNLSIGIETPWHTVVTTLDYDAIDLLIDALQRPDSIGTCIATPDGGITVTASGGGDDLCDITIRVGDAIATSCLLTLEKAKVAAIIIATITGRPH